MESFEMDSVCSIEQNKKLLEDADPNNPSDSFVDGVRSIGPNEELLGAVDSGDLASFKTIMTSRPVNLHHVYPSAGTILDACCERTDRADFVRELLSRGGVDVNRFGAAGGKAPIHVAAANGREAVLDALLDELETDVDALDGDGNSALHLATAAGSVECVSLLLNSHRNVKPNQLNERGETPAYLAAVSERKDTRLMAQFIKCPRVYLSMQTAGGKPLREVVEDNYPRLAAFEYLYSGDAAGFVWHATTTGQVDGHDGEHTYLGYACAHRMPSVARALLRLGADPNARTGPQGARPLFVAARLGHADVVRAFLDGGGASVAMADDDADAVTPYYASALHAALAGRALRGDDADDRRRTCDALLPAQCAVLPVDRADPLGDTCLHYAARARDRPTAVALLERGACVGATNGRGEPPLARLGPDALRAYLDGRVRVVEAPPHSGPKHHCALPTCSDEGYDDEVKCRIECPYAFLRPPPAASPKAVVPETHPLLYMSRVPRLRPLLSHPALAAFVRAKWSRARRFYLARLAFYLGFLASFASYVVLRPTDVAQKTGRDAAVSRWVVVIYDACFAVCQSLLFASDPWRYATNPGNWMKITAIVSTAGASSESLTEKIRTPSCVVAILTSLGVSVICILDGHPKFAVPSSMFKAVCKNVLRSLAWYSVFVGAFVLSVRVLFENENDTLGDLFLTPFAASTGGESDSNRFPFFPNLLFGRLLFVVFVLFIPIVMWNLLNGLATSDVRKIQKDAEIIALVSQIKFIHSFETMLARNVFSRINSGSIGRNVLSTLAQYLGMDPRLFPDASKNPEITISPIIKNINHFESINEDEQIIKSNEESIESLVEQVKEIKQILNLKKRENNTENNSNVFVKPVDTFNTTLNWQEQQKTDENNTDVIVKAVEEFQSLINSVKNKMSIENNMNATVKAGFKEMLILEEIKTSIKKKIRMFCENIEQNLNN